MTSYFIEEFMCTAYALSQCDTIFVVVYDVPVCVRCINQSILYCSSCM